MKPQRLPVSRHRCDDLSDDQLRAVWALIHSVFPSRTETLEERLAKFAASEDRRRMEVFVVWEGAAALANAAVFQRTIATDADTLNVMALAAVCTAPGRRGEGLGRAVVAEAFRLVDACAYPVSLFQTGVPAFYEKLGARRVFNSFVNTRYDPADRHGSPDAPWWEPHVMVYPAVYDWPAGTIDLLGAGY